MRNPAAEIAAQPDAGTQRSAAPSLADVTPFAVVVTALAALPADQRAVVVLRHVLGYTPGEIAKLLGYPRGTVNSRLRRGLDRLAADLDEETS